MQSRTSTSRGFTLIEVLVAFMILTLSLVALLNIFSGSLRSVRLGEDYAYAAALARARLAQIDADGMLGNWTDTGETEEGFRWHVTATPYPLQSPRPAGTIFGPVTVTVNVAWGVLDSRSVSLSTIRLVRR